MARPTINLATPIAPYSAGFKASTTTTECALANTAGSGKLIKLTSLVMPSNDAGNDTAANVYLYDQDGTPMNDDTGNYLRGVGADAVEGSSIMRLAPIASPLLATGGQVFIDTRTPFWIEENQSIVIQMANANRGDVWFSYEVWG